MKIVKDEWKDGCHHFYFDNGAWVGIIPSQFLWEYSGGEDDYLAGWYVANDGVVTQIDQEFGLPNEVLIALDIDYVMDAGFGTW